MDKPVQPVSDPRNLADFLERKYPGQFPTLVGEWRKKPVVKPVTAQPAAVKR